MLFEIDMMMILRAKTGRIIVALVFFTKNTYYFVCYVKQSQWCDYWN